MEKIISFATAPLGSYTENQIAGDWNYPKRIMGADRCLIREDPLDPSRHVLEVKYPKGKVGQEITGGGAQWRFRFEKPCEKCTAEYRVMFPKDFGFVKGGKLPGLCGGTSPGGGKPSDGSDGFSARIMWREQGEIFSYLYWMERSPDKKWGDNLPWTNVDGDTVPFRFVPGQWHTLKVEIVMNTQGERNGEIKSWLDGQLALYCKGAFRAEGAQFSIDSFNFTTFFGGNTSDWAPLKDEVAYFADFKIFGK